MFRGVGMPVSYCLAAAAVSDLPPQKCVYPDGTEVVTGPPDDPCPGPDGSLLVCGGTCGEARCPAGSKSELGYHIPSCVGLSDTRAYGICAFSERRCAESNARAEVGACNHAELSWFAEDCACMMTTPRPDFDGEPTGFVVPAHACKEYQSHYPDQVECRDEDWNLL